MEETGGPGPREGWEGSHASTGVLLTSLLVFIRTRQLSESHPFRFYGDYIVLEVSII